MDVKKRMESLLHVRKEWNDVPIFRNNSKYNGGYSNPNQGYNGPIKDEVRRYASEAKPDVLSSKGILARIVFLIVPIVLLAVAVCAAVGNLALIWSAVAALRKVGIALGALAIASLVIPSLYLTWNQIWGPRFPLAAVLSLAVSIVLVAALAWGIANFQTLFSVVVWQWECQTAVALYSTIGVALILPAFIGILLCLPLHEWLEAVNMLEYKRLYEQTKNATESDMEGE